MKRQLSREQTKERLLDEGLSHFIRRGYHGTGIKDIVDSAGLPKGSFYTYFDSKEAFGGAVLDTFADRGKLKFEKAFSQASDPIDGFKRFFTIMRNALVDDDFQGGCLLGNLANELGSLAESVTPHLAKGLSGMSQLFAGELAQAQAQRLIRQDLSPETLGDLLLDGWEGTLIRAKANRSTQPLDKFISLFFDQLLHP